MNERESMDRTDLVIASVAVVCFLFMVSCGYQVSRPPVIKEPNAKLVFADISPTLAQFCVRCHRGEDPAGSYDLSSHSTVLKNVVAGDSSASVLCQRINDGTMPPRGAKPSVEQVKQVCDWIDQGALL